MVLHQVDTECLVTVRGNGDLWEEGEMNFSVESRGGGWRGLYHI